MKKILFFVVLFVGLMTSKAYAKTEDTAIYNLSRETIIEEVEEDCSYIRNVPLEDELLKYICETCSQYGFDYEIFLGLLYVETGGTFKTNLVSKANAVGLCQIRVKYKEYFCESVGLKASDISLYNPYDSVHLAVALLNNIKQSCVKTYEGTDLYRVVLGIYNRGASGMKDYVEENGTLKTDYSEAILKRANTYKEG